MKAVYLSRDDYRLFNVKVGILEKKGYDLPHMVEHNREEDTFKVTLHGEHDVEELDRLCSSTN